MYNSTVSDLLEDAAYDTSYDGIEIRELCDENYLQDTLDTDDLVITEIEIEGLHCNVLCPRMGWLLWCKHRNLQG